MGLWIAWYKKTRVFCHIEVPEFQTKETSLAPSYLTDIARFYPSIWQNALSANRSHDKFSPEITGRYSPGVLSESWRCFHIESLQRAARKDSIIRLVTRQLASAFSSQIVCGFFYKPGFLKISSLNAIQKKTEAVSWTYNFVEARHNLESTHYSALRFPCTMFPIKTSSNHFCSRGE